MELNKSYYKNQINNKIRGFKFEQKGKLLVADGNKRMHRKKPSIGSHMRFFDPNHRNTGQTEKLFP